jgi:Smg protein
MTGVFLMYHVLAYLFEHCQRNEVAHDGERLAKKLSAAGFEPSDIAEALGWLDGVVHAPALGECALPDSRKSFRAYAPRELVKLDAACRGLLLQLEQCALLTPHNRERVVERALAASGEALSVDQLKLIVLMVLWNEQTPTSRLIAEDVLAGGAARPPN